VPWARLVEVIAPYYPTGKRGRPPVGIERMLRLHFLQHRKVRYRGLEKTPGNCG
jgi:hypothetical protein